MKNKLKITFITILFLSFFILFSSVNVYASGDNIQLPYFDIQMGATNEPQAASSSIQILLLMTIISLAPSILIMMTCFTRIIIVLSFVRNALGTQQMPPNQILVGLAIFLTLFIMGPIFTEINETALQPFSKGEISQDIALEKGMKPIRTFMFNQVENKDVALFLELSGDTFETKEDLPNRILIPAFILGELTKGFKFGVIIFIPFIVIDMIVSSILMAMGMMMLPPSMISMPFKILLFVLAGGWNLLIENLVKTFRM